MNLLPDLPGPLKAQLQPWVAAWPSPDGRVLRPRVPRPFGTHAPCRPGGGAGARPWRPPCPSGWPELSVQPLVSPGRREARVGPRSCSPRTSMRFQVEQQQSWSSIHVAPSAWLTVGAPEAGPCHLSPVLSTQSHTCNLRATDNIIDNKTKRET